MDATPQPVAVPCHRCSGTGWATWEDRHTETNRDRCTACGGNGWEPARTGESRETSWPYAVPAAAAAREEEERRAALSSTGESHGPV